MNKDIIIKYLTAELKKLEEESKEDMCPDCGHCPHSEDVWTNISFVENKIKELNATSN